jgi:hypothetical protein
MEKLYPVLALVLCLHLQAFAQLESSFPSASVNYKVVQDDPNDLNHLWIHVNPFTFDASGLNTAIGSGFDITYLPISKLELKAGITGNLINSFDVQRNVAQRNAAIFTQDSKRDQGQMVITNNFSRFVESEIGGQYAFWEKIVDGSSKIILADQPIPEKAFSSEKIEVDAKTKMLISGRLGFNYLQTTVGINKALDKQDKNLKGSAGTILSSTGTQTPNGFSTESNSNGLFSNFSSAGFYFGGAFQKIKNITIKTDRQGILNNNSILSFYGDIFFNPWTKLENLEARKVGSGQNESFDVSPVALGNWGARTGFELRYNQSSFVSMGGELGYRPAIQGQGWYAMVKLSIPTFSFGKTSRKVSNNVGKNQSLSQ